MSFLGPPSSVWVSGGWSFSWHVVHVAGCEVIIGHAPKKNLFDGAAANLFDERAFSSYFDVNERLPASLETPLWRMQERYLSSVLAKAGHMLLVERQTGESKVDQTRIRLSHGNKGNPFFEIHGSRGSTTPRLSITHSTRDVFVAICDSPVGIDHETIKGRDHSWASISGIEGKVAFLSDAIDGLGELTKECVETLAWCCKEATLKASGVMPGEGLKGIEMDVEDGRLVTRINGTPWRCRVKWWFHDTEVLVVVVGEQSPAHSP